MPEKPYFATSLLRRARGLLGMRALPKCCDVIVIAPCADVHTFAMKTPIDLAFLDGFGRVMLAERGVGPWRRVRCRGASCAIERFTCDSCWFEEGDVVSIDYMKGRAGHEEVPGMPNDAV